MTRGTAIMVGNFNPPTQLHRETAKKLLEEFDRVLVIPREPDSLSRSSAEVESIHRATMVDMTFGDVSGVEISLHDLEHDTYCEPADLEHRYANDELWYVVLAEQVTGGRNGNSQIQQGWKDGQRIWGESRFVIVTSPGDVVLEADRPPTSRTLTAAAKSDGRTVRNRAFHGESLTGLVVPRVEQYIARHGLYRGLVPSGRTQFQIDRPNWMIVYDERNQLAAEVAATIPKATGEPDAIVVIGGDGTMLRAIRDLWRLRLPLFGINAGHLGFLLNDVPADQFVGTSQESVTLVHLPLMYVEYETADGQIHTDIAFNDAWVERAAGQTAWICVLVDGAERISPLVADGVLVATAAGSASYARAMGASPLPLGTRTLTLVGSNVLRPPDWKPAYLPLESTIEFRTVDSEKRPLQGYIDGVACGPVRRMWVRMSNIAAVELLFAHGFDPTSKLAKLQFPSRVM